LDMRLLDVMILGVQVSLCVDGVPLEEFDDSASDDEPLKGVKFVEATSGKHFTIRVKAYKPELGGCRLDHLDVNILVDGKRAVSKILNVHTPLPSSWYIKDLEGVDRRLNNQYVLEKFAFADLDTSKYARDLPKLATSADDD
jgi:hypothetical protein